MGKVHKIIGLFMVTFIAFTVCGCAREEKELQSEQVQIGMAFDSFVIERWQRDKKTFIDTAANAGAEVIVQNANGDVEKQIEQVRYLMEKKVDAIVIIPVDAEKITDVIQEAKAEGIIIIAYDRMIKNADADLYISFDNESVGRMMGEAMVEACQRIVEGTQIVTIYKSVDTLASTAAECTLKLINDQELENTSYINDGTYEIPYIALEPVSVTKNNLDEVIIESGFHSREDVYLNLPSTN